MLITEIFNVGLDRGCKEEYACCELCDNDLDCIKTISYDWIVYSYYYECYEGDGELVGKIGNELHVYNLSHNSCYGPLNDPYRHGLGTAEVIKIEDYLSSNDVLDTDIQYKKVKEKVLELLGK